MVRHPGYFTRHATPTTRLNSIEALLQIFPLRCARVAFSERRSMGILELSCSLAWRFRGELKSLGDENPRRRRDGDFSSDRDALDCAREIRMARGPQSGERLPVSQCLRRFGRDRLRALLRGQRKPARVGELDKFCQSHYLVRLVRIPDGHRRAFK